MAALSRGIAGTVAIVAVAVLAGCDTGERRAKTGAFPSAPAAPSKPGRPPAPPGTSAPASSAAPPSAPAAPRPLPDLAGKNLQAAQDAAQAAGFRDLTSHDLTGQRRSQLSDRGWKVCTQSPGPGLVDPGTRIDFGVVKTRERCPRSQRTAR